MDAYAVETETRTAPAATTLRLVTRAEVAAIYAGQQRATNRARRVARAKRERELAETLACGVMLGVLAMAAAILWAGPALLARWAS